MLFELANGPKVIFMNCCRGSDYPFVKMSLRTGEFVNGDSNISAIWSTTKQKMSLDSENGEALIQCINKMFRQREVMQSTHLNDRKRC